MRIYIVNPDMFAKHANKFVLLSIELDQATTKQIVIRDQSGDVQSVSIDTLDIEYEQDELVQELLDNMHLREVALEDGLIEVGDYNHSDTDYLNYSTIHY
jgi:hypothetical protein